MTATYKPYALVNGAYTQQKYPSNYPVGVVGGSLIVKGTGDMSVNLTNVTEFSDEPANKGTFEYAGVFQNVPLFFMKTNKAATMSFKITCNAYSSLPLFLKYCNTWGQLTLVENEFYGQDTVGGTQTNPTVTNSYYVTLESTITEKPVFYGKTVFDISLKFTRVQI